VVLRYTVLVAYVDCCRCCCCCRHLCLGGPVTSVARSPRWPGRFGGTLIPKPLTTTTTTTCRVSQSSRDLRHFCHGTAGSWKVCERALDLLTFYCFLFLFKNIFVIGWFCCHLLSFVVVVAFVVVVCCLFLFCATLHPEQLQGARRCRRRRFQDFAAVSWLQLVLFFI
jgi:hypothetical protein